jgi:hypothetical protein
MTRFLSLAIVALMISGAVNAQHFNVGIKAGLNLYNIHNSNGAEYDMKPGLVAGLLGHIHLSKQFAFQPELVFSGQGAKYTTAGVDTKINLNYLNVPLMLQYMFDNGFRLHAGPQIGFLMTAKSVTGDVKTDIKDNLKPIDVAVGLGLGYIHVPSGFGLNARYNLGLTNINENTSVKSTNRGFQLGVFYQFQHKS